jgi:pyrimidine-nucleoside phosphorylase
MSFVDLIIKKRDGGELTTDEINSFVQGVTQNTIPDYQLSAMLMAICLKSLNDRETVDLTMAMASSGTILDLSAVDGITVDKHSTGGVADTTTLILAPLTASLGLKVIKMSGRGLGHTGGTLDKLESIPGFCVSLEKQQAIHQVNDIGIAIMGQTDDLAPADKRMYAMRDVTGTVESIPLIAASIMSKKIAAGSDAIVLDVKCGNGAFMKNITDARKLADTMVRIGKSVGKKTCALITAMDTPLGMNIGNSLEVIEAIDILKGQYADSRLKSVALELGARMLVFGGIAKDISTALTMLNQNIENRKGLAKFKQLIAAQDGNPLVCEDYSLFPHSKEDYTLVSDSDGYISRINTAEIGRASVVTGAGRVVKDAPVDLSAGLIMQVTAGDYIRKGDTIARIFSSDYATCLTAADIVKSAITVSDDKPDTIPPVLEVIE